MAEPRQNLRGFLKTHKKLESRDGNWEIYVMSVDGELVQLTDDPADDFAPDWSPDGSKLVFSSNRAGKQHIYLMNSDGTSAAQLTNSVWRRY